MQFKLHFFKLYFNILIKILNFILIYLKLIFQLEQVSVSRKAE